MQPNPLYPSLTDSEVEKVVNDIKGYISSSTETLIDFTDKIVLGTVQFGMDYGIANVSGQPTKSVFKILEIAWQHGIRSYDTAPSYDSEDLLGEFIKVHGLKKG